METVQSSSSLPTHIKAKQLLYFVQGYVYFKSSKSVQDYLYCFNYYQTKCPAKVVIDQKANRGQILAHHSHSKPSKHFWNQFDSSDYDVLHLPYKLVDLNLRYGRSLPECKYCQQSFHDFDLLKQHQKWHEIRYRPFWRSQSIIDGRLYDESLPGSSDYTCGYCQQSFVSAEDLRLHDKSNLYHCASCKTCFSSAPEYLRHQHDCTTNKLPSHQLGNVNLNLNLTKLPSTSDISSQQVVYTNFGEIEGMFHVCKHCHNRYKCKESLREHNLNYPIFCTVCQTCLASVSEYLKHQTIHRRYAKKDPSIKNCRFCGVQFDSKNPMWNHVCKGPLLDKFLVKGEKHKKTYECKLCSRSFQSYERMITHATFKCKKRRSRKAVDTECGIQAVNKSGIQPAPTSVVSKKGRPRKNLCRKCMNCFPSQAKLSSHKCLGNYSSCSLCHKWFRSPSKLSEHMDECHSCSVCRTMNNGSDQLFQSKHLLQVHIRRNHKVPCPHCKQTFVSLNMLFEHVKSDHKCRFCKNETFLSSKEELDKHERWRHWWQLGKLTENSSTCSSKSLTDHPFKNSKKYRFVKNLDDGTVIIQGERNKTPCE